MSTGGKLGTISGNLAVRKQDQNHLQRNTEKEGFIGRTPYKRSLKQKLTEVAEDTSATLLLLFHRSNSRIK
jgi:hypothetical protein